MIKTKVRNQFYTKFTFIMFVTILVVFTISCAMIAVQIQKSTDTELLQRRENFKVTALSLDNLIVSVVEHVELLHNEAELFLLEEKHQPSVLYQNLEQHPNNYYHLDTVPSPYSSRVVGNLTGAGSLNTISHAKREELEMALKLNTLFKATKDNIANTAWVYYTSKNEFINIYPWVESKSFKFSEELYTHEFYSWGLPDVNTKRELFWTPAYIDEYGMGMMVTCAKPVYRGTDFLGTVAIDITLDQLTEYVKEADQGAGTVIIFNEQDQLLAHPTLVSSKDKTLKKFFDGLPASLQHSPVRHGIPDDIRPLEQADESGYYYTYYKMENVPWKIVFFIEKKIILMHSLASIGILFFTLIGGLALMLFVTNRITFQEFIDPAAKMVDYLSYENKNKSIPIPKVPAPWLPWFKSIKLIFAEKRLLIEEIEEKNEALTERNLSIERYMPKFILILSLNKGVGNTSISNYIASTISNFESNDKKTVYMSFPKAEDIFSKMNIPPSDNHVFKHPNGYDIWTSYNLGSHQQQLKSSLLLSKVMNAYENIIMNAFVENDILDEDLQQMVKYAKAVITIVPPEEGVVKRVEKIRKQVTQIIRQDKTNLYTILNRSHEKFKNMSFTEQMDFEIPFCEKPYQLESTAYSVPSLIQPTINALVDRLERVHQISVFIPTTINVDREVDTSGYVQKTMVLLGERFGGATSSQAKGVWNSAEAGLVDETVHIVVTYTTEFGLNEYVDDVIEYVRKMKSELSQEAMAIEIDKKMMLI